MFAKIFALFLVMLASAAAINCNYAMCFPGQYCDAPVAQVGTYDNAQLCSNKCASQAANKYASYVPSSKQCLCSKTCLTKPTNVNPNVNTYCLNKPSYKQCWAGKYCGPNSSIKTQPGKYANPQACVEKCWSVNQGFNFFNYVPSSQQCQCVTGCSLVTNPNVYSYAINDQTCTASNTLRSE